MFSTEEHFNFASISLAMLSSSCPSSNTRHLNRKYAIYCTVTLHYWHSIVLLKIASSVFRSTHSGNYVWMLGIIRDCSQQTALLRNGNKNMLNSLDTEIGHETWADGNLFRKMSWTWISTMSNRLARNKTCLFSLVFVIVIQGTMEWHPQFSDRSWYLTKNHHAEKNLIQLQKVVFTKMKAYKTRQ